jgi:hypothetical protein
MAVVRVPKLPYGVVGTKRGSSSQKYRTLVRELGENQLASIFVIFLLMTMFGRPRYCFGGARLPPRTWIRKCLFLM